MNKSNSGAPLRRRSSARSEGQSRASLHSKSSAFSSCRICLSSIRRPAVLACGHQFCEKCLEEYWSESEKLDFIVCPLCRANTSNINFAKKEETPSADDFRKKFTTTSQDVSVAAQNNTTMVLCLKITTLMTTLYYTAKWLWLPLWDLFTFFRTHWSH